MTSSGVESVELLSKHSAPRSSSPPSAAALKPPHKARWFTLEYLAYFACLGWALFAGAGVVYDLSKDANPLVHRQLQPGWLFGRRVDLADGQYRFFRAELPLLTAAAAGFLVLSHAVRHFSNNSLRARLYFYFTFSFCFLLFANGSCIVFMLAIITVNYAIGWIGLRVPSLAYLVPPATWIFNCLILLLNERYNGYSWVALLGVGGLGGESWDSPRGVAAQWLDQHRGLFPWFRLFNLVVLRMISFNIDRHWSFLQMMPRDREGGVITFEKHQRKCVEGCMARGREGACAWWREKDSHPLQSYNPIAYFSYLFYVPLHFAGPTITFNSWVDQVAHPQQSYTPLGVVWYALGRTAFIFLVLETWLHLFYVFSFTHSTAFLGFTPYGMALVSYFTLVAIWLKFTALWRFFRLWSLADGVEAPENMNRCVSNNYSVQSFWRGWHRSFNRWLVRYVYVPLGGGASSAPAAGATAATAGGAAATGEGKSSSSSPSAGVLAGLWSAYSLRYPRLAPLSRQLFNVFLTFSFVAFWHDRTMQLLAWGWMIALLFVPELGVTALFNLRQLRTVKQEWYWRHIKGVGAAMSIFTMMVANLVGYSVGIHGTSSILHTMVTQGGLTMFVLIFAIFFSASMIMFECRETGITVD